MGNEYIDTDKVTIRRINKKVAKDMIIEYHYTHAWSSCKYALGVYYEDKNSSYFGKNKLIGCIVYGTPVGSRAADSISHELKQGQVLELKRLYIHDGYGKNIESYSISKSFDWLRENDPNIKVLISYADSEQDHLGIIYQATNWIYQGRSSDIQLMDNYRISLTKNPYDWIHSRTCVSKFGSNNLEHLKKVIGEMGYSEFWRKKDMGKYRYVYILEQNKGRRKKIFKTLKHGSKPYPKENLEEGTEVEHYNTYEPEYSNKNNYW